MDTKLLYIMFKGTTMDDDNTNIVYCVFEHTIILCWPVDRYLERCWLERETLASEILAGEELGLEALLGFGNAGWA